MNIKCIKKYVDRYSLEEIKPGTVLTVTDERGQHLIEEGVVEETTEEPKEDDLADFPDNAEG